MLKKAKNAKTPAPAPAPAPTPAAPPPTKAPGKKPSKADGERPTVESILAAQSSLLYRGGSRVTETYDVIPFGIYGLDRYVLEVGGAIRGRIYEVVGHQSAGKSTLCLQLVANAQARGLQVAYIDAEHALDTAWAAARGVSIEDLLVGQPNCGEEALELVDSLCNSYQVGLVVIDSVAALVPKAELEGAMGDAHMGLQARLMSQALRKLVSIVAKSKTCVVFTNQYRKGMGGAFAPENVPTGGNALKFYASVRIEVTNMGKIKSGEGEDAEVIGNEIRITAVKNKTAAPWRMIKLPLLFNSGYDDVANMVDLAVSNELSCVRKLSSSMWEVFGATVRGRSAAIEAARARADDLRAALDAFYRDGVVG